MYLDYTYMFTQRVYISNFHPNRKSERDKYWRTVIEVCNTRASKTTVAKKVKFLSFFFIYFANILFYL